MRACWGPVGPILMFSQMRSEVVNPFVCSRASFAVVPPIFVSTVDMSSETGGMAL